MYSLLIVDDMPIITDGLVKLFQGEERLGLEIHKAYSGFQAIEIMKNRRIDIVLSDILMPGMDGIELLRHIHSHWPACKVVLLTSHSDFNYVQSAMSLGSLEYILKTESDEKIVQAIEKAIQALDKENEASRLINKAEAHMRLALPTLQKEYVGSLIQGKKVPAALLGEHFANIQLPLRADAPVLVLIGRIDDWNELTMAPDKSLIIYAVQNIVEEMLSNTVISMSLVYESSKIIWLIQPGDDLPVDWESAFHHVNERLENIQDTCMRLLHLSVSFVLSSQETEWPDLADKFHSLKYLLVRGLGGHKGTLLTETNGSWNGKHLLHELVSASPDKQSIRQLQSKIPILLNALESGNEEEFDRIYEEVTPVFLDEKLPVMRKIELYHALSYVFLTFVNKYDMESELGEQVDWSKLVHYDDEVPWKQWDAFFRQLACLIFTVNRQDQEQSTHEVVRKVHSFIESNLSADLSLNQLADHVHLNPSYLSRLYKQMTGTGLSEHMSEVRDRKAKEMLMISHLRVHEIAANLGYNSSHAFSRFFKKQNGITPQEYRELQGV